MLQRFSETTLLRHFPEGNWEDVRSQLREKLGEAVFTSWFATLKLEGMENGILYLSVPTKFLRMWISERFSKELESVVEQHIPHAPKVVINVRSAAKPKATTANGSSRPDVPKKSIVRPLRFARPVQEPQVQMLRPVNGSPLDSRFDFGAFLVNRSNQAACEAAENAALASDSDAPQFNPLCIYGAPGVGKTHLLQATAQTATKLCRKILYTSAEKFMHEFVEALKHSREKELLAAMSRLDLLIIDHFQFLQGTSIQRETFALLEKMVCKGKQIVIAIDRPPSEMKYLEERNRMRLTAALPIEMKSFDEDLRMRFLQARVNAEKLLHPKLEFTEAAFARVAQIVRGNGHELERAICLLVSWCAHNGALTPEAVESVLSKPVASPRQKRVKVEEILRVVADHCNVSRDDILSSRRTANMVRPRQIAMYLAKILTANSLPEIGKRFGGKDHTTVLHAVRKMERLAKEDRKFAEELDMLKLILMS